LHQAALGPSLPANKEAALLEAIDRVNKLDPDKKCKKKVVRRLSTLGFDLPSFQAYLGGGVRLIDGTRSLARPHGAIYPNAISAKDFLLRKGLPENALVRDVFKSTRNGATTNAITSIVHKQQLTIFLRPDSIDVDDEKRNAGLIFHEGLHGFSASLGSNWGDAELARILKVNLERGSVGITRRIASSCF
jgi:hypothetical protein